MTTVRVADVNSRVINMVRDNFFLKIFYTHCTKTPIIIILFKFAFSEKKKRPRVVFCDLKSYL